MTTQRALIPGWRARRGKLGAVVCGGDPLAMKLVSVRLIAAHMSPHRFLSSPLPIRPLLCHLPRVSYISLRSALARLQMEHPRPRSLPGPS
jgi:hypothetical protein